MLYFNLHLSIKLLHHDLVMWRHNQDICIMTYPCLSQAGYWDILHIHTYMHVFVWGEGGYWDAWQMHILCTYLYICVRGGVYGNIYIYSCTIGKPTLFQQMTQIPQKDEYCRILKVNYHNLSAHGGKMMHLQSKGCIFPLKMMNC